MIAVTQRDDFHVRPIPPPLKMKFESGPFKVERYFDFPKKLGSKVIVSGLYPTIPDLQVGYKL